MKRSTYPQQYCSPFKQSTTSKQEYKYKVCENVISINMIIKSVKKLLMLVNVDGNQHISIENVLYAWKRDISDKKCQVRVIAMHVIPIQSSHSSPNLHISIESRVTLPIAKTLVKSPKGHFRVRRLFDYLIQIVIHLLST